MAIKPATVTVPAEAVPSRPSAARAKTGRRTAAQIRASAARAEAKFNRAVHERVEAMLPEAIAAKVQEILPALAEQLVAARQTANVPEPAVAKAGDQALLEGLAHAMAKASDPANKRRIVDPSVMRRRAEADERMRSLLLDFHAQGRVPVYRVVDKTYLANMLIQPEYQDDATKKMVDQTINWPGVPNQALAPINDEAQQVMKQFLMSIDALPRDTSQDIASFVLSGNQVMRGRAGVERAPVSEGVANDPRRGGPGSKEVPKTLAILGSIHEPAVLSQ